MPFEKGRSGNPRGRPKGSRNRATTIAQVLIDHEGEAIARKAVDLALAGDVACLRMCLERLVAPRKDSPIRVDLGKEADVRSNTAQGLTALLGRMIELVMNGDLSPDEGYQLARILEVKRKSIETHSLEERLSALEQRLGGGK